LSEFFHYSFIGEPYNFEVEVRIRLIRGGGYNWMLKMMVIEDNDLDREAIEQLVGSLSHFKWLGGFSKPKDALCEMVRNTPDVVITAVEIPEMNGLSFTSMLQERFPDVQVIVTARSSRYAREAYEAGARGYIIKPFDRESLLRLLENVRTRGTNENT
jgi:two-component system response regulator AlgR